MSCESCTDQARERMMDLDNIRLQAKKYAQEINQPVAICQDGGYYTAPIFEAINNGAHIIEVISNL